MNDIRLSRQSNETWLLLPNLITGNVKDTGVCWCDYQQGRSQDGATGANEFVRLSGAPEDLLLAYVESP